MTSEEPDRLNLKFFKEHDFISLIGAGLDFIIWRIEPDLLKKTFIAFPIVFHSCIPLGKASKNRNDIGLGKAT